MSKFVFIAVPADGLEPLDAETYSCTLITNFTVCIFVGQYLKGYKTIRYSILFIEVTLTCNK